MITRDQCAVLDSRDPLAPYRDRFDLPDGVVYLDGNSLGPLPRTVRERLHTVVDDQWGRDLIRSWNVHGWIDLPLRTGAKIAPLIGADPSEVAVADSTSVDLFKLLAAALELQGGARSGRSVILSEEGNFPTDLYVADGLGRLLGDRGCSLRTLPREAFARDGAVDDDVAVAMLTQVDYRTGAVHDLGEVTRRVQEAGALMLWDLSHSAGALPVDLRGAGADFAVGCGYKYLNGGPGAPAYLFVAERHHADVRTPIQGWLGHDAPFAFTEEYRPADGIARFLCGTPPVLSLAALDAALDVFEDVEMTALRTKSKALGDLFLELIEQECGDHDDLEIACPRAAHARGNQVSLRHPEGYAVVQALIDRGVIGDFREPDVLRFGLAPLYLRHVDVWDAVRHLAEVLDEREWDRPAFRRRGAVT